MMQSGLLSVMDSVIEGNEASKYGGGIMMQSGLLSVMDSVIEGNEANYGGGMYTEGHELRMANTVVRANTGIVAGGIRCYGDVSLAHVTVAGNRAVQGGGIYLALGTLELNNSIVSANIADRYVELCGNTVGVGSIIGPDAGFVRVPDDGGDGWGDDPATPGDESANDDYGDLRLRQESPGVDAGVLAAAVGPDGQALEWDLAGRPRLAYAAVDAGAYEYCLPGDVNLDGLVDVGDLGVLAWHWGQESVRWPQADMNDDRVVDVGDLGILAANWGLELTDIPAGTAEAAMVPGTSGGQANRFRELTGSAATSTRASVLPADDAADGGPRAMVGGLHILGGASREASMGWRAQRPGMGQGQVLPPRPDGEVDLLAGDLDEIGGRLGLLLP
jgi:hypothetical protein